MVHIEHGATVEISPVTARSMSVDRGDLVPVNTGLVLETLVETIVARVQQGGGEGPSEAVAAVLEAEGRALAGANDPALDRGLRHAGYRARIVEAELFEPARRAADWLPGALREGFLQSGAWAEAVAALCAGLAHAEPLDRPGPDDPDAVSWRIPGPGGHVRHYVARRTIGEHLRALDGPVDGDPAALKRPWLYGFLVRACEEALPEDAVLDDRP
jgi:hypothetical protein